MLVREGFSWAGFFFGFLYLAAHRAWIQAALFFAANVLLTALCYGYGSGAPFLGLAVLQGLFARDMLRWSLAQRGYSEGPVVAGASRDLAFSRLLDSCPLTAGAAT